MKKKTSSPSNILYKVHAAFNNWDTFLTYRTTFFLCEHTEWFIYVFELIRGSIVQIVINVIKESVSSSSYIP